MYSTDSNCVSHFSTPGAAIMYNLAIVRPSEHHAPGHDVDDVTAWRRACTVHHNLQRAHSCLSIYTRHIHQCEPCFHKWATHCVSSAMCYCNQCGVHSCPCEALSHLCGAHSRLSSTCDASSPGALTSLRPSSAAALPAQAQCVAHAEQPASPGPLRSPGES
jgi:hypothetical protein